MIFDTETGILCDMPLETWLEKARYSERAPGNLDCYYCFRICIRSQRDAWWCGRSRTYGAEGASGFSLAFPVSVDTGPLVH